MDIDSIVTLAREEGVTVVLRPDGSPAAKPTPSPALMRILAAHRADVILAARAGLFAPLKQAAEPFRCDKCAAWVYDPDAWMVCEFVNKYRREHTCPLDPNR